MQVPSSSVSSSRSASRGGIRPAIGPVASHRTITTVVVPRRYAGTLRTTTSWVTPANPACSSTAWPSRKPPSAESRRPASSLSRVSNRSRAAATGTGTGTATSTNTRPAEQPPAATARAQRPSRPRGMTPPRVMKRRPARPRCPSDGTTSGLAGVAVTCPGSVSPPVPSRVGRRSGDRPHSGAPTRAIITPRCQVVGNRDESPCSTRRVTAEVSRVRVLGPVWDRVRRVPAAAARESVGALGGRPRR